MERVRRLHLQIVGPTGSASSLAAETHRLRISLRSGRPPRIAAFALEHYEAEIADVVRGPH